MQVIYKLLSNTSLMEDSVLCHMLTCLLVGKGLQCEGEKCVCPSGMKHVGDHCECKYLLDINTFIAHDCDNWSLHCEDGGHLRSLQD